jgi:hypothetical protein
MMRTRELALLLCFLFVSSAGMRNCRGIKIKPPSDSAGQSERQLVGRYLSAVWADSAGGSSTERLMVLVLYPADLGCMPCMLNFMDFCDTMQRLLPYTPWVHGMMLVVRGQGSYADQRRKITAWAAAGNLRLPLYLIDQDFLVQHHILHTSVAVTDSSGNLEMEEEFPLATETRNTLLARLTIR